MALLAKDVFVFTAHHVLFDFWCSQFVFDDVAEVYANQVPKLRPSSARFSHHIAKLEIASSKQFWTKALEEAQPTHPPLGDIGGNSPTGFEAGVKGDIRSFTASHSVTTGSLVYAAWVKVLATHARRADVSMAIALSGRDAPLKDLARMIRRERWPYVLNGRRSGWHCLCARRAGHALANSSSRSAWDASGTASRSHLGVSPYDTLVHARIRTERPLLTRETFKQHGDRHPGQTKSATLEAGESSDDLSIRLNSELDANRARFLLAATVHVVATIIAQPGIRLGDIDTVPAEERACLRSLSPPAQRHTPALLHAPFEAVEERTPAVALQYLDSEYVGYDQPNKRANAMAQLQRNMGVKTVAIVPLCVE